MTPISGQSVLITGAAHGIGAETARRLAARGARVSLVGLGADELRRVAADCPGSVVFDADVTDPAALEAAVAGTVKAFGGIDTVVANAGIAAPGFVRTMDPAAFERIVEVNLLGVWRTARACLPQLTERGGHIVVVASVYAFMNPALAAPYAISKAGVEQMGRALRAELSPHGASASVAYFGFIDTKMVQDSFEDPVAASLEDLAPSFFLRRLSPAKAGEAIVNGLETRAPRIVAPGWWRVLSALRGLLNPLMDARLERDRQAHDLVRRAEADDPGSKRGQLAEPAHRTG
jgi:NAD(P)-dependent dehydrogenase (short-subunit alcohol dehydrogenase family)